MTVDHEHPASSGLIWFKSTYSGSGGGDCVEVAINSGMVHVRDSKDSMGQQLTFTGPAWKEFLATATES
ncbi:DUF397 domain-containing protein [Streptomyces sp. TRM68416]|uniref:DUF397 domain-containing protein n=1 Tax=Streptomyces sp. TRM68416 TaxID=2758412 RepID=UPI001661D629|nr:DUF397 domain-containing protein [Streptomyces sp. TRM68416]MBD0843502.1 DUF397 domain-containing protein [Streptomyces sp. TRM68416]